MTLLSTFYFLLSTFYFLLYIFTFTFYTAFALYFCFILLEIVASEVSGIISDFALYSTFNLLSKLSE